MPLRLSGCGIKAKMDAQFFFVGGEPSVKIELVIKAKNRESQKKNVIIFLPLYDSAADDTVSGHARDENC